MKGCAHGKANSYLENIYFLSLSQYILFVFLFRCPILLVIPFDSQYVYACRFSKRWFSFFSAKIEIGCLTRVSKRDVSHCVLDNILLRLTQFYACIYQCLRIRSLFGGALGDCICKFFFRFILCMLFYFASSHSHTPKTHKQTINLCFNILVET